MEIRATRPDEWDRLRATRLAAVTDAPTAYLSTLEETLAHGEDVWRRYATPSETHSNFVAVDHDAWVGMCAVLRDDAADRGQVVAVWVDPGHRRCGIGSGLIAATAEWCRLRGINTLHLWVNESNAAAVALYVRTGFGPSGDRKPMDGHPGHFEIAMSRPVAQSR